MTPETSSACDVNINAFLVAKRWRLLGDGAALVGLFGEY
jgi:hypothetical protein